MKSFKVFKPITEFKVKKPIAKQHAVIVYRGQKMQGAGHAGALTVVQVPGNKADELPCKRLRKF